MPLREDDVAPRTGVPSRRRTVLQALGLVLAVAATLAVFLTDNPQVLRLAVVGVAWAFVLATLAAGRRSADQGDARAREVELRRAHELELDRGVVARREYELELESELRREAETSMRAEFDAVRGELAALTELRDEVARVADLRTDLAALSGLRDEVARLAALRDDVAELAPLRQELGQLAGLRDDMGRLRAELTEQLSSEMLIERIVMRTQAGRLGADLTDVPGRAIDAATRWNGEAPPRELDGGWSAVRLDEPRETRQFDHVRVERSARPPMPPPPVPPVSRPVPSPSWRPSWEAGPQQPRETPATATWEQVRPQEDRCPPPAGAAPEPPLRSSTASSTAENVRYDAVPAATARPVTPPEPLPSPLEWLAERSLIDPEPTSFRPDVPPRRRRGDESAMDPASAATTQRPAVRAHPPIRVDDLGGSRVPVDGERTAEPAEPSPSQEKRLADILAENGVSPSAGGRRRRRYRDEDEPDDVLARVLGTD